MRERDKSKVLHEISGRVRLGGKRRGPRIKPQGTFSESGGEWMIVKRFQVQWILGAPVATENYGSWDARENELES